MRTLLADLPLASRIELVELIEEETPVGTWHWNIPENEFLWSPRQTVHFGLQPLPSGLIEFETWLESIHHDDREIVHAAIARTIATGEPLDMTFRAFWRDDACVPQIDVRWFRSRGRLVRAADGSALRMLGTSRDVTEEKTMPERDNSAVQHAKSFGDAACGEGLLPPSGDCLFQLKVEADGRFTYQMINTAGLRVINMTMAAARGLTPIDVLGVDNGSWLIAGLRTAVETGRPFHYQPMFYFGAHASTHDAIYTPVRNELGEITSILGTARSMIRQHPPMNSLQ